MKNSTLLLLALTFVSGNALAVNYADISRSRVDELVGMNSSTVHNDSAPKCQSRYRNLYKDGTLNVALGFGYWDSSPRELVFDQWIANGLRIILQEPCSAGKRVCGFKRTGDVFTKTVRGPDGKPNKLTVSFTQGSLSADNVKNTTTHKAQQKEKCEAATAKYFGEISRGAEVVMFIGHARKGGGPDFCPPVRKADNHTNYSWYQTNRYGFKSFLSSLRDARAIGKPAEIVAMYSCYSKRLFLPELSRQNPGTGFILTEIAIETREAVKSIVSTLDSIIAMKCSQGFQESAHLSQGVDIYSMFR